MIHNLQAVFLLQFLTQFVACHGYYLLAMSQPIFSEPVGILLACGCFVGVLRNRVVLHSVQIFFCHLWGIVSYFVLCILWHLCGLYTMCFTSYTTKHDRTDVERKYNIYRLYLDKYLSHHTQVAEVPRKIDNDKSSYRYAGNIIVFFICIKNFHNNITIPYTLAIRYYFIC